MKKFELGQKANWRRLVKELGCQIVTQLIIDRYKHLQEDKLVFGKMRSTFGRLARPRTTGRCARG